MARQRYNVFVKLFRYCGVALKLYLCIIIVVYDGKEDEVFIIRLKKGALEDKYMHFVFLQITGALNFLVRNTSDVETNVVSVERVKEYTEAETEV